VYRDSELGEPRISRIGACHGLYVSLIGKASVDTVVQGQMKITTRRSRLRESGKVMLHFLHLLHLYL
jgi:hypothetical protein